MDVPGQFSAAELLTVLSRDAAAAKAYQSVFGQVMPRDVTRRLGGGEEGFRDAEIESRILSDGRLRMILGKSLAKKLKNQSYFMARTFDMEARIVEHTLLKFHTKLQGQSTSKRLMGAQMRLYQDWGIKRIDVTAGKDVGGYTWARYGFEPVHRQDFRRQVLQRFEGMRSINR